MMSFIPWTITCLPAPRRSSQDGVGHQDYRFASTTAPRSVRVIRDIDAGAIKNDVFETNVCSCSLSGQTSKEHSINTTVHTALNYHLVLIGNCFFDAVLGHVRMPVDQLPKRLDGAHHAGHGVGPTAGRPIDGEHRARRRTAQVAQEPPLEPEVDAQPLGNRDPPMPKASAWQDTNCR
jgi:hypothetical protein